MRGKLVARPFAPGASEPSLPAERAFVVQLGAQTGDNLFIGRAEHIASGATVRFGSADELIAFIADVLAPAASR